MCSAECSCIMHSRPKERNDAVQVKEPHLQRQRCESTLSWGSTPLRCQKGAEHIFDIHQAARLTNHASAIVTWAVRGTGIPVRIDIGGRVN